MRSISFMATVVLTLTAGLLFTQCSSDRYAISSRNTAPDRDEYDIEAALTYLTDEALLDRFDNLDLVGGYRGPILVIHGRRDDLIPYDHGVSLVEAAPNGRLLTYDCVHNDCPPSWSVYWRDVGAFLVDHGIVSPTG